MSFEEEVAKFCKSDRTTVVDINSEQILHDIVDFTLRLLMKNHHDDFFNVFDADFIFGINVFGKEISEFVPDSFLKGLCCSLHDLLNQ